MKYVKHKDGDIHNNDVKNLEISENSGQGGAGFTGAQLKAIRLRLGMTQEEIAPLLGIKRQQVNKLENKVCVITDSVKLLAIALNQKLDMPLTGPDLAPDLAKE